MLKAKKVFPIVVATVLWFIGISIADAAITFQSPSAGTVYTKTADIAAGGNGATNSCPFILQCKNGIGVVEQSVNGTSMPMGGYWSGLLTNPNGGWSLDQGNNNHSLKVIDGNGVTATVDIFVK